MTDYETEVVDHFLTAYKMLGTAIQLGISAAQIVGDGDQPITAEEREVIVFAKHFAEAVSDLCESLGLLVGKSSDVELCRVDSIRQGLDRGLKRDYDMALLDIAALDHVAYTERPAPVNPESLIVATKALPLVAADLGIIDSPKIRWFSEKAGSADATTFRSVPETKGKVEYDPPTVWVHVDRAPKDAIATLAHECKHIGQLAQARQGVKRDVLAEVAEVPYSQRPMEVDAHGYGELWALKLWGPTGLGQAGLWLRQARTEAYAAHGNF